MPISPAMRCSPGREPRGGSHKRGCSLESGIVFKDKDDDLALFSEMQNKESDSFLLQSNDDFEDIFETKLRHFSDHKHGITVAARGESSDLLNAEEEKNDYEWLMTPPDTPLFPSLDDDTPRVNPAQRGRPRAQPITISRSSTMEKSHRSSRGSPSPNRLSPSPRSHEPTFQPRARATSAPSSSPPPTRRPITGPRRPSSPSKPSSPPPRASPPPSRRLSTGSTTSRGISGNSPSQKVKAWQVNIPGFSTEAPPNLRTSLADRPAYYVRGSSPASRNGRKSMSPTAPRSIGSSCGKGSVASDDDIESLPSVIVDGSDRLNSRRVSGFRNISYNKVPSPQKANRTVTSSSAPKRSFDVALRQMDHRKGPQNMFRPLLSSVPTSNFYAGKSSPAWNSSVTTSSNASSDLATSGPHDIEEHEHIDDDDATSGITKVPDSNLNDEEIFMFEKTDSLNEDTKTMQVLDDFNGRDDTLVCSRCGCEYAVTLTKDDVKLCLNCQKSTSALTVNDTVSDHEFVNDTVKPLLTLVKHEELVHDQLNHDEISQSSLSYSDTRGEREQIQQTVDFQKSKDESIEGKGVLTILERCSSIKGPVTRSRNFSASSISYDALSYMSASSSVDFGPRLQSQLSSRRSDMENYKYDPGNAKHRRSMSSLSATSSHAFRPSSVGTSTLDSFDVSVPVERDVAESASVGPQENPSENDTCAENIDSVEVLIPEIVNDDRVFDVHVERDVADSASVGPQENSRENVDSVEVLLPDIVNDDRVFDVHVERDVADSASVGPQENLRENVDSVEVLLPETVNDDCVFDVHVERDVAESASVGPQENLSENVDSAEVLNVEEAALVLKDEELGKDSDALVTCTVEEGTSLTGSSSPASQCHVLEHSENGIEELRDPQVSEAVSKDMEVSDMDINNLNHSSSINEESTVLVEGERGTKGRSLTLEEATDTILFCSSIIHNLAYEAANIAIDKQTPPEPSENNDYPPLVPAITKSYPDRKDLQTRKTSKRSSKSQKTKKKTETDTIKTPNNLNTDEETELQKTRIVYSNNKENTKPPTLEAKCNCRIM